MPDEMTVTPIPEPDPAPIVSSAEKPAANPARVQLVNLCALGLGISFFLPWAHVFFATPSGYDLQQLGHGQLLLWLIPAGCVATIVAGFINMPRQIIGQLTGMTPFVVGLYWLCKLQDDFFPSLTYGAYLSLFFGATLFILIRKCK